MSALETFLAAAPGHLQPVLRRSVDHAARALAEKIEKRPNAVLRASAANAEAAIELVTDVVALGWIHRKDRRIRVQSAVHGHPLWMTIPHEELCTTCNGVYGHHTGVNAETTWTPEEIESLIELPCAEALATIAIRGGRHVVESLWNEPRARTVLTRSARFLIHATLSDLPFGREHAGSIPYAQLNRLLHQQADGNRALLELTVASVRGTTTVPRHWSLDDADWRHLLEQHPQTTLLLSMSPPQQVIVDAWSGLSARTKLNLIASSTNGKDLEELLDLYAEDAASAALNRLDLNAILLRLPDLDERIVRKLLRCCRPHDVSLFLLGRMGGPPSEELANAVLDDLLREDAYADGADPAACLVSAFHADHSDGLSSTSRWRATLLELLVRRLPVNSMTRNAGPVHQRLQEILWEQLDAGTHAESVYVLLRDWQGTLPDLIEAVKRL